MESKSNYILGVLTVVVVVGLLIMWSRSTLTPVREDGEQATSTISAVVTDAGSGTQGAGNKTPGVVRPYVVNGVKIIYYTDKGFDPFLVEVKKGEEVRFVNLDNETMRVAAVEVNNKSFTGFAQSTSVGRGGIFGVTMSDVGTWGYYNLNNPADRGAVVVRE
ncbi:MAG: hypothetical protein A2542_03860 [Parcubacteria group bacterium RIFOXYD2_FULL_52_8]|nr:MAG: hypothetical protein A2542_03860 [Parcubacteria group bacterium RIFOXYD2_FULL_52_8]